MARLALTATHELPRDEAIRRVKQKLDLVLARFRSKVTDLQEKWNDGTLSFRFKAGGMKVSGTVTVTDTEVRAAAEVPFAAMLFKKKIEKILREELSALLSIAVPLKSTQAG